MTSRFHLGFLAAWIVLAVSRGSLLGATNSFDAAPYALPLPDGQGLTWEDPREIHKVVVHFRGAVPEPGQVHLEYWGSRWPQQHLPKDREPGGADVGWMELGNWYKGDWRIADTEVAAGNSTLEFTFQPINTKEFPGLKDYNARFRYTLKLRVTGGASLGIERIEAFTDSTWAERVVRLAWQTKPKTAAGYEVFNGVMSGTRKISDRVTELRLKVAVNDDPNTFDRTLVTVRNGKEVFTFRVDDLARGALWAPDFGVAVTAGEDARDYGAVAAEVRGRGAKTLYDRVAGMPEQTWHAAWAGIPRKKSDIYFPLGLDGGRQRFRLDADGSISFRHKDALLRQRPGADTPGLDLEPPNVKFSFGLPAKPAFRTLDEESLPICSTTWRTNGLTVTEVAFVTGLGGSQSAGPVPPADMTAVLLAKLVFTNASETRREAQLPIRYTVENVGQPLRVDEKGELWRGENLRGEVSANRPATIADLKWNWALDPGEAVTVVVKIPYLALSGEAERARLRSLDFEAQRAAVAGYWHRRLEESARLITPEPMLNEFYRADAGHLLINCEREPNSTRRFARVGSFYYGAFGNESCMMVVDLDRRGYHREAQECLEAWLHYQGTVGLPGDFASQEGVLYGAGGYEEGGYNQHHGWILWALVEHYRFTRDQTWLKGAVPGILKAVDWIGRERRRTLDRHELERGLLPAGSLEDIGDWWTWLSTSCYTWRGLDSAAWALEQVRHPEAKRVRAEATDFHSALMANFLKASQRSPIVRLRDGTCVPQIPSQVHRRGRSFGWICQTLEGSLHLLITGALDSHSAEAGWILKDYEDNLYLSNQYGYTVPDFEKYWFDRGGMSMQACLLLDVEPYLYRDDVKHALRALFNAESVSYFPDVRMNTEHAAPYFDDWRGDHYKSSDESNCAGWLRQLFVREDGERLLLGQAVPREWLAAGQTCGLERAATWFGEVSVVYTGGADEISAHIAGPRRNPPKSIRLRFRAPGERLPVAVTVNGKPWKGFKGEWVELPGDVGTAAVTARYGTASR